MEMLDGSLQIILRLFQKKKLQRFFFYFFFEKIELFEMKIQFIIYFINSNCRLLKNLKLTKIKMIQKELMQKKIVLGIMHIKHWSQFKFFKDIKKKKSQIKQFLINKNFFFLETKFPINWISSWRSGSRRGRGRTKSF